MNHEDKSRRGFIRTMAREIIVQNSKVSITEAIERATKLYDDTATETHTHIHTGEYYGRRNTKE